MKKPWIVANWKLNKNPEETKAFAQELLSESSSEEQEHLVILPPALCAQSLSEALGNSPVAWGVQNVYSENAGAFTGENSAQTAKAMGAQFVLIGHSERRQLFYENQVAEKLVLVQALGLTPILCVGETWEERQQGKTQSVVEAQLQEALGLQKNLSSLFVAYEPVWAIGTGESASEEQAGEVHAYLRQKLSELMGESMAQEVPLLYGGSVKPEKAMGLFAQTHVDGFLVGGASLEVDTFLGILRQASVRHQSFDPLL
jgi:triosephosphate isomerase